MGVAGPLTVCASPQSYTTCALGIQFVGYVMICFAAVNALCSVLYRKLSKFTGRTALFALGRWTRARWGPCPRAGLAPLAAPAVQCDQCQGHGEDGVGRRH